MMNGMKYSTDLMIAWWLMWIGAVNWGLVGIGGFMGRNWNVVNLILGGWPQVEWIVYVLVGLSAIYVMAKKSGMMSK